MFKNRIEAGKLLVQKLLNYKNTEVVIVAIPRGGLPIGGVVASTLNAPLDVALTKKIGHPINKEYAIGAVSLAHKFITDSEATNTNYIEKETSRIRKVLGEQLKQYYKNSSPRNLKGKVVIIVDDGIATGNTMLTTIALIKDHKPSKIIVAIPVAPMSAIEKLHNFAFVDEVICLHTPKYFQAVGQFYSEFNSVSNDTAIQILEETNKHLK